MSDKSPSNPMEQFLLLARGTKGAAASHLISQALEAPGIYVFAELLDCNNIKELAHSDEHKSYYLLLQIFAYGVYEDYIKDSSNLPPLNEAKLKKLRHLTLVSLATGQKSLSLSSLSSHLALTSTRELEDLIIEAIYADILHGRLDQKNGVFDVEFAIGRDIKPENLSTIINTLDSWQSTCNTMLSKVDALITGANLCREEHMRHVNSLDTEIANIKVSLKSQCQDSDENLITESREHDKKRSIKKMTSRGPSSKLWNK